VRVVIVRRTNHDPRSSPYCVQRYILVLVYGLQLQPQNLCPHQYQSPGAPMTKQPTLVAGLCDGFTKRRAPNGDMRRRPRPYGTLPCSHCSTIGWAHGAGEHMHTCTPAHNVWCSVLAAPFAPCLLESRPPFAAPHTPVQSAGSERHHYPRHHRAPTTRQKPHERADCAAHEAWGRSAQARCTPPPKWVRGRTLWTHAASG